MWGYCDRCDKRKPDLQSVMVAKQTHWSPAEWERWCRDCVGPDIDAWDLEYERQAARYDGTGKDWR